jgi:HD-like signal output (HDOD) protein
MGSISVDSLKKGMILSEDVLDINARRLLSKGQQIITKHIRVLKIWGITEVHIVGEKCKKKLEEPKADPETVEKVITSTKEIFINLDLEHPAVKEIFDLSVTHRCEIYNTRKKDTIKFQMEGIPEDKKKINVLKKIETLSIKLPEIPSIVNELNEITADPFASANDIGEIVNKSPSLTAILLKIVNSAFYSFPSKIDTVSRAVTLIGSKEITGLAVGLSTMSVFKDIPEDVIGMKSFLRHSLLCGLISRIIASQMNMAQTEQMFVSGLLHDIGRLIIYQYFPDQAKRLLKTVLDSQQSLYSLEDEYLGSRHTEIGKILLKTWKLSSALENNVRYHHRPSSASIPLEAGIVHIADVISNGLGMGSSGEKIIPTFDYKIWQDLNISAQLFKSVIDLAVHQLASLETYFKSED